MQFRTKARAVDLLGKGQIADLPTAITELWKNGYDAYASILTAEIFTAGYKGIDSPLFMMTDDGMGMSQTDILDKWLVLGTDSKSRRESDVEGDKTLFKKPRVKAGEKGIGRLSVAFLGSPMLMLTKKVGHPVQMVLFDWRLLENFNLFLDNISIPIADYNRGDSIDLTISELKKDFLKNFDKVKDLEGRLIWDGDQKKLKISIIDSIEALSIPSFFNDEILNGLSEKKSHGTRFIIFEPSEEISNLVGGRDDENLEDNFVRSNLSGFINPFIETNSDVEIKFPIHKEVGEDYDYLTGNSNFFTSKDFELADIIIEGEFSGTGKFSGTLKFYDKTVDYEFTNQRKRYKNVDFGAVPIKLGYSLGQEKSSKFERSKWKLIGDKVKRYGGLYVYRDSFRVLPYGREDSDFLEFEKRRSKRAATAFFSYRRMFGFLDLSRERNEHLRDKSSREGLINNSEYKVFKSDMVAFFVKLASDYFTDDPKQSLFFDEKEKRKNQHEALTLDKARIAAEKRSFTAALKAYPFRLDAYKDEYQSQIDFLRKCISGNSISYVDIEKTLGRIKKMDIDYLDLIPRIPAKYKPTDRQMDLLEEFSLQIKEFNETIKSESEELLKEVHERLAIQDLHKQFDADAEQYKAKLEKLVFDNRTLLSNKFKSLEREFNQKANGALDEITIKKDRLKSRIETKYDTIAGIREIQEKFEAMREELNHEVFPLVSHIETLGFEINEELLQGAYRAEYEVIKHQWEQTRETAQLGIAVEIIDHEFNVLYSQINASIKKLDKSIDANSKKNFEHLSSFFKSLEDKYALLSPLYRDAGVIEKEISGKKIEAYLLNFFDRKVTEEEILLKASPAFLKHSFEGKEPVIHTVFINIVNNAIYWLRSSDRKEILLDYNKKSGEMMILNSGEPIEEHRLDKIFKLFESNRPGGRGIGLYLSRESLAENYFELYATNDQQYNKLGGACFVIKPMT